MTNTNKHSNTIRINGRVYNAATGAVIDGVIGSHVPKVALAAPRIPAKPQLPVSTVAQKSVMDVSRTPAPHHKRHAPQSGKTLMRSSVPKPSSSLKRTTRAHGPASALAKAKAPIVIKSAVHSIDSARTSRAANVSKSTAIKRFGGHVTTAPASTKPIASARLALATEQARSAAGHILHRADMFERAIATATSHQQPAHKSQAKRRRSVVSTYTSAALALVLLGGFITYQNTTNIKLQFASSRAGFQAELPSNRPSGFSMAALSYQPGSVDVRYRSNSDDRSFAITQKASAWDSQALRETFLSSTAGSDYKTVETGGRTIYVYGDNNATWVNGGVWYQVNSEGSLSSRQLVDLATSM